MSEVRFRSDIMVTEYAEACCGSDKTMYRAAKAIPPDQDPGDPGRTLAACVKLGHNTVFEAGLFSVYAEAPGVVWWQLTRQRFMSLNAEDFSFNLESGRYKHLEPEFYVPGPDRPCCEPDGFKPMRPVLASDAAAASVFSGMLAVAIGEAWRYYRKSIDMGIAREVARLCLPNWALYCDGYVTAKPLSWLQFFSKRNRTPDTATPTFPQWEIEEFARQCEALFAARWPETHAAFAEFGRRAP